MENTHENMPFGLAAVEMEQSQEHFELGAVTPGAGVPAVYMPEFEGQVPSYGLFVENQAKQPACGSHAGYELAAILKTLERGSVQHGSPEYLWKKIKEIDGLPIEAGTDMGSIFKALNKFGICESYLLPNNAAGETLEVYASKADLTEDMELNAAHNRIGVYAFTWSPTLDQIKAAIYAHKAVIVLARIGAEWWSPSWTEKDLMPLKPTQPIVSGHFVTAFAYDEQYIYFYNHWTNQWGRLGLGYFGQEYMSRVVMIGTAVNLAGNFQFTRSMTIGATGTDVGILQIILKKYEKVFPETQKATSYFGPVTKEAVKKFQLKYADEILVPAGIPKDQPTGNVGPFTLKKLNAIIAASK